MTTAPPHKHAFVTTRTGPRAKRRCTICPTTWRWDATRADWVENTTAGTVWMLLQVGDGG